MKFIQSVKRRLRRLFMRRPQTAALAATRSRTEIYLLAGGKLTLLVAATICIVMYHVVAALATAIFGGLIESLFEW